MTELEYPKNWSCTRLKNVALVNENSLSTSTHSDYVLNYLEISNVNNRGIISKNQIRELFFSDAPSRARRIVRNGDTVISSVRPNLQALAYIKHTPENLIASTGFYVVTPLQKLLDEKYTYYLLISDGSRQHLEAAAKGVGYPAVDDKDFVTLKFSIPSIEEQQRIASYLDKNCATIDKAIEAKQKQLEILDALRKSIIHKAVTRGLDDSVELKDSGVEWLGKTPKHWNVRRIKRYAQIKRGASPRPIADQIYFDDDGEYAWVRIADVSASDRYLEKTTQKLSDLGASLSVKQNPGDLFISIAGTVGKPIITKIKCCIHDGFIWFDNPKFNKDFLYYIFLSEAPYQGLGKLGTQLNLNTDTIGQIFISIPSKKEQLHIVDCLDKKCSELTELQTNIKDQISTLEQYRKSLIHECVTGKRRSAG